MSELKKIVLGLPLTKNESIMGAQRSLISQLCRWNRGFDYSILAHLLVSLQSENFQWSIDILFTILEDIRFDTENMNLYETPEFS